MAQEPGMEQIVARAVRDNLASLQRLSDELNQAMADVVAACSSSRPANALPAMLRAQGAAASLAASLEVVTRFVAGTATTVIRVTAEAAAALEEAPAPRVPTVGSAAVASAADAGREMASEGGPAPIPVVKVPAASPAEPAAAPAVITPPPPPPPMPEPAPAPAAPVEEEKPAFEVGKLSAEEQELHRRANRVAKVSMQDIKMLRPDDIKLGREKKDLCARLRVDLDKARKEYDRRFKTILSHPVDYFYDWLVDIIADGDPKALGDYPYARTAPRRSS